jgi:hypothetical protein
MELKTVVPENGKKIGDKEEKIKSDVANCRGSI